MKDCMNKWTTNITSLNDAEFEELLDHAEHCQFHEDILDRYEAGTLSLINFAYADSLGNFAKMNPDGGISPGFRFHNYMGTSVSCVPERYSPRGRTVAEEVISEKIKQIMQTGMTPENCRKCLEILEQNDFIVKNSWSQTLNKARFLIVLGEKKEAEKILHFVKNKYSSREAIASVFEILSWLDELEFINGGQVDEQLLDRRMNYITEGLRLYPKNYVLITNAFEVACLKRFVTEAIGYLDKLAKFDNKIAAQYLLDSPIKEKIFSLDKRLREKVFKLSPELRTMV